MSLILLFLGVISISLLIFGFLKSNNIIKSIGFIILFLIVFISVYFLFLTPPENIKQGWIKYIKYKVFTEYPIKNPRKSSTRI